MLSKRQFMGLYDEAVSSVRVLKNYNDRLNKSMGVVNEITLYYETQANDQGMNRQIEKIENLIIEMEKVYLDPDTSRKIGLIKSQFRMQNDRRNQLLATIAEVTMSFQKTKTPRPEQKKQKMESMEMESSGRKTNYDRNQKRSSVITTTTEAQSQIMDSHQTQVQMDSNQFDYEMQRKLLHEKNQYIGKAHQKMISIRDIVHETSSMVYDQGDRLDIIEDDMFTAYRNIQTGNEDLNEASKQQKKARAKRICFILFCLTIVGAACLFFFLFQQRS